MSIIHDALKKTQNKLTGKKDPEPAPANPENTPPANQDKKDVDVASLYEKHRHAKIEADQKRNAPQTQATKKEPVTWHQGVLTFFAVLVFLGATGFSVLYYFKTTSPKKFNRMLATVKQNLRGKSGSRTMTEKRTLPAPTAPAPAPVQAAANTSSQNKTPLLLNGIVQGAQGYAALINSRIYEAGADIEGRKILKISIDQVEIQDGENIITLRVGDKR